MVMLSYTRKRGEALQAGARMPVERQLGMKRFERHSEVQVFDT
jgi:hypothetical protein